MRFLYSIGIRLYFFAALVMSAWDRKAAKWIDGRRGWRKKVRGIFRSDDRVVWFHCASLGEFEQGRPLMEMVRERHPEYRILLTFFSPSGYEKRKDYGVADHVCYLPPDTKRNAEDFIGAFPIEKAIFIKYEFWYYFLKTLNTSGIPAYLASGSFSSNHLFFRWYGKWFRRIPGFFTHIFVQEDQSAELIKSISVDHVTVAGDTRFDRVITIASNPERFPWMDRFSGGLPLVIGGSTYEPDEQLLLKAYQKLRGRCKYVIAPHEVNDRNTRRLLGLFPGSQLFSEIKEGKAPASNVIIVDTIGHLSSLYSYGTIAFVGGGFGKGIHNLLEPAAHGIPVFFGPNCSRFPEAAGLIAAGAGHPVDRDTDLAGKFYFFLDQPEERQRVKEILGQFFLARTGATVRILNHIFE